MDAFEQVVAMLLDRDGYWTRTSYKVELTKAEKVKIGIPSCPRWELDVIAYKPKENRLLVVECKSYLNSPGVSYASLSGENQKGARRYKLFNDSTLRRTVLSRLKKQLKKAGLVTSGVKAQLCLAAGHVRKGNEDKVRQYCRKKGWQLFDREWFAEHFTNLPETDYENNVAVVAAKLAKAARDSEPREDV